MSFLSWKLAGVLVVVLVTAAGAWQVQDWRYGKQLSDLAKTRAQDIANAEHRARSEEQRRQAAVEKVGSDAREQSKVANADAGAANAVGDGLRAAARKLAYQANNDASDTGVTARGASATRAAMVLSDLFQRADKRAGELAAAYDQARIAGLACERSYGAIFEK
ncbi:DUF2514 family protein [Pseudomonas sp. 681]|uniref:DUF2514 family protein n=1 Tax=Pseudomonas fungipugnans TaxID=3024217 RepID=A0ABT6QG83_9PSED|nr:DUF2514 family protein [Pseudomonas sp. 681]MDI2589886.1 DUF2514 family protein [Pseudomonas sp. 681]